MKGRARRKAPAIATVAAACFVAMLGLASPGFSATSPDSPPARDKGGADLGAFVKDILGVRGTRGHIKAKSVKWRAFPPATDLDASLQITEDGGWRLEKMQGDQCGGRMTGSAAIRFGSADRRFNFAARWIGVRLEEVTRYIKRPVIPGIVSASADITMTSKGREGLSGDVKLSLRNGNLGGFPMVLKALSLLSFPGVNKEDIENADARMTLTPRAIVFQDLSLGSADGAFRLKAERLGSIGYDGKLDVYFRPEIGKGLLASVPVAGDLVNKILDDITKRSMRIHVTGDTGSPRFQWAAFKMGRD